MVSYANKYKRSLDILTGNTNTNSNNSNNNNSNGILPSINIMQGSTGGGGMTLSNDVETLTRAFTYTNNNSNDNFNNIKTRRNNNNNKKSRGGVVMPSMSPSEDHLADFKVRFRTIIITIPIPITIIKVGLVPTYSL